MRRTLFKNFSTCKRYFLYPPQTLEPHRIHLNGNNRPLTCLSPSTPFKLLRLLSSKPDSFAATNSDPLAETDSAETQKEASSSTYVDDVSSEELKRRIERYFEGDAEAIPSIFEAILKRKLAGKHDDSDDELMEKLGPKLANDVIDEELDSEED